MYSATLYRSYSSSVDDTRDNREKLKLVYFSLFNAMAANKSEWFRFDKHHITHYFPSVSFGQNTTISADWMSSRCRSATRLECVFDAERERYARRFFQIKAFQCRNATRFVSRLVQAHICTETQNSDRDEMDTIWFSCYKRHTSGSSILQIPYTRTFQVVVRDANENIDVLTCKVARTLANHFSFLSSLCFRVGNCIEENQMTAVRIQMAIK